MIQQLTEWIWGNCRIYPNFLSRCIFQSYSKLTFDFPSFPFSFKSENERKIISFFCLFEAGKFSVFNIIQHLRKRWIKKKVNKNLIEYYICLANFLLGGSVHVYIYTGIYIYACVCVSVCVCVCEWVSECVGVCVCACVCACVCV